MQRQTAHSFSSAVVALPRTGSHTPAIKCCRCCCYSCLIAIWKSWLCLWFKVKWLLFVRSHCQPATAAAVFGLLCVARRLAGGYFIRIAFKFTLKFHTSFSLSLFLFISSFPSLAIICCVDFYFYLSFLHDFSRLCFRRLSRVFFYCVVITVLLLQHSHTRAHVHITLAANAHFSWIFLIISG